MDRRSFLLLGAGTTAGVGLLGFRLLRDSPSDSAPPHRSGPDSTSSTTTGPSPSYSELEPADAHGIQLPRGFTARVIATSGVVVSGTSYTWHGAPDGATCFADPDGGWVYVSNSEQTPGGVGALRFAADGTVIDAYRILDGSAHNCSGGRTSWDTWLSCEEIADGQVWECDPFGRREAVVRPAMGSFRHEAVACDAVGKCLYLTEDAPEGKLRRFRPDTWGDLSAGTLESAVVVSDVRVEWTTEVDSGTPFNGGEGIWYADDKVWFTTKGDNRVWELNVRAAPNTIRVLYDDDTSSTPVLTGADNIMRSTWGDLFVAEDAGNMELVRIAPSGAASPFLRVLNQDASEITGPAFSPDGTRLYFSSQRGPSGSGTGITYEVQGPFRA